VIESTFDRAVAKIRTQNIAAMRRDGVSEADIADFDEMNEREFLKWKREKMEFLVYAIWGATLADAPTRLQ
jgi:hypothetical protein